MFTGSLLATEGAKTFDSASTTSTDGVISRGDCGLTGGWINLDKWSSFIGLSSGKTCKPPGRKRLRAYTNGPYSAVRADCTQIWPEQAQFYLDCNI